MCSPSPRTQVDPQRTNGFGSEHAGRTGSILDLREVRPQSARTPRPRSSAGHSSTNSPLLSPRHSVASMSSSRTCGQRELWSTPDVFQVGRLGNMKEALQQENLDRCERRAESRRLKTEAEKAMRQRKYEELLESQRLAKERARVERLQAVEARNLKSWTEEQARQRSRERLKLEEEKQALIPALRLELVERKKEAREQQEMREQGEYEHRVHLRMDTVEKQKAAEKWIRETDSDLPLIRYKMRQEEIQRRQRELKAQRSGYKECNQLRTKKVNAVHQARVEAERFQVDVAEHAVVQQRVEKQEEKQRRSQIREVALKDQRDKERQVVRAKREQIDKMQHMLQERDHAIRCAQRTRSLEAQEREREAKKIQHELEVEKRNVRSTRLHMRQWDEGTPQRWGQRDVSLTKSDGDLMTLRLASMLSPRARSSIATESRRSQ